jgi:hypothetical protein
MSYRRDSTKVSLRGSLCRDLLTMVASGMSANEAAQRLISDLLNARNSHCSVRLDGGVFVIERSNDAAHSEPVPPTYQ